MKTEVALLLRVAARFQRQADQPPGARKETKYLVTPVNKPKGMSREVIKDYGASDSSREDTVAPNRRDLRPQDLFQPTPNNVNVLNFAESGKSMDKNLRNQIPKDKGYDTVSNLSQYLLSTGGGGDTPSVLKKR